VSSLPYPTTSTSAGAVCASCCQTGASYDFPTRRTSDRLAVTPDTAVPSGGALTVDGTAASAAGTSSYNSSGSFTISAIADYTDAGSGLASSTLTRQAATLSAGTCGSFGAATTIGSRLTPIV